MAGKFNAASLNLHREPGRAMAEAAESGSASLIERENRYRSLFESMDEGFCIIQMIFDERERPIDYRFLEINPAFERHTDLHDALGKTMRELAPEHEQHWFDMYGRIALNGEPARFINRAEQLHRWYEVYAWRFGDPKDKQVAVLFNDITERTQAEAKVRESEERFRAVFNQQFQFMALLSPEGKVLEVNELALSATGVRREQVMDKLFWETPYWAHLPEMRRAWPARLGAAASADGPLLSEDRYQTGQGELRFAHAAVTAVKDDRGGVQFFIIQATDITEHKKAEQALRDSEERLSLALAVSETGVWDWDMVRDQAIISDSYRQLFEIAADEPFGYEQWLSRVHPEDRDRCRAYGESFFASPDATNWNLEFRIMTPSRGVRCHHAVGIASRAADGRPVRFIGVSSDITERKHAEEALQLHRKSLEEMLRERTEEIVVAQKKLATSQRMAAVGTLAAGLAHDMNNLLLPLSARLDLLRLHRQVAPEVHTELVVIAALLDHLRDLSKNLSLFSRDPEKEGIVGRTNLEQWHASVHKLLNASVGRDIVIHWDCPSGLPDVAIAPHRLTQAVQNLIHNARDAVLAARAQSASSTSPYLPRISIEARSKEVRGGDPTVELKVSDNGSGMDEETKQRCIEPFFTTRDRIVASGEVTTSAAAHGVGHSSGGSGLGLSLAHQIVERAGGSMQIESTLCVGTSITLTIPVAK